MKNKTFLAIGLVAFFLLITLAIYNLNQKSHKYGAPPYIDEQDSVQSLIQTQDTSTWIRPDGPIKIGLQAGHWKTNEMPQEQERIKDSGGGTSSQGVAEWEVVLKIAEETKLILEKEGYVVDILPATVPEEYWADAFVSIHADGNLNPLVAGYKVAPYRRDQTQKADDLSDAIEKSYGELTGFKLDPNISRNMTGYYAFNSRRYKHAINPMTPGVIVETGFLTNYSDANVLINNPEIPAKGIVQGIIEFVTSNF